MSPCGGECLRRDRVRAKVRVRVRDRIRVKNSYLSIYNCGFRQEHRRNSYKHL